MSAVKHRQPDKIPYNVGFTQKMRAIMIERYGEGLLSEANVYFKSAKYRAPWHKRPVGPDLFEDEFGAIWDQSRDKDIGVVCNRVVTPDNVDTYPFPDPHDPARYERTAASIAARDDCFIQGMLGFSLFERAWILAGMETVLDSMLCNPEFVNRLLDRILEFNLGVIDHLCDLGVDAIQIGDDWGSQNGVLMGAPLWREFILPRIVQMYSHAKRKNKFVFIHCCGKVQELFPDLIAAGLDVFNPFQPEVMDVYQMKRDFGRDLCFFGGISTQKLLPFGTVQEVKDTVRRLLDEIGKDGGYICSPAHGIPADAKPENVAAMIEVLTSQ